MMCEFEFQDTGYSKSLYAQTDTDTETLNMKISLKMTGCKNNRYELDKIQEWAVKNGVGIATDEEADFSVINTCTVTHIADRKSRQMVRKTKNLNPKLKTIVFGCAARMQKKEFEKIGEIDYLLPDLKAVMEFLENMNKKSIYPSGGDIGQCRLPIEGVADFNHSRALVQIQDGCDNFCSYCIIAAARGKSKSRTADEIIDEINTHVKNGFNEVILTGINIGAYGCGMTTKPEESKIAELLQKILDNTKIQRIRLSSMGPEYFLSPLYPVPATATDTFQFELQCGDTGKGLFKILKNPRMCRHIHLSVQSGSDSVLKRMRRNYSVKQMDEIIKRLKKDIPGMAVTADVIVGFPEETNEEFKETVDFVKRNKFAKVHVFPYSIRKNTLAAKMKQVLDEIKKTRARELQKISDKLRKDFIKNQIGKKTNVLWKFDDTGITDNYVTVKNLKKSAPKTMSEMVLSEDNAIDLI
jgi:threonylcarbamoyladenosine tRNA methylthiotransferase MtaB